MFYTDEIVNQNQCKVSFSSIEIIAISAVLINLKMEI